MERLKKTSPAQGHSWDYGAAGVRASSARETGPPHLLGSAMASSSGHRLEFGPLCSDWSWPHPCKWEVCLRKLEHKISGELFAQAPVKQYLGTAEETVTDSSFCFAIWFQSDSGYRAFMGIPFKGQDNAFDFNILLQNRFKWDSQRIWNQIWLWKTTLSTSCSSGNTNCMYIAILYSSIVALSLK